MRLWLAVVLAVAGCATGPVPSPHPLERPLPEGAITGERAIEIAQNHLGGNAVFVSAIAGNRAGFVPADPELVNTWIVRFTGDFPRGCPLGGACPRFVHEATVLVDLFTGEWLSAEYS